MLRSMMTPLGQAIHDNFVETNKVSTGNHGTVVYYDYVTKRARVLVLDPATCNQFIYNNVMTIDPGRGFKMISVKPGDKVWLSFNGQSPVITSVFTSRDKEEDLTVHYGPQIPLYNSYLGG